MLRAQIAAIKAPRAKTLLAAILMFLGASGGLQAAAEE